MESENMRNENPFRDLEPQKVGFFKEWVLFLKQNKKWWLFPVMALVLLGGLLVFLSGTAAAPFIYTLF